MSKRFLRSTAILFCLLLLMVVGIFTISGNAAPKVTKMIVRTLHPDGDPFKKNLQDCIDEFNATNKFNVKFEMETITGSDPYKTKIRADMAAGNGPDVFYWWVEGEIKPFADNGKVVAFNKYLDMDKKWKDSFIGGVLDKASINGKVYSIPSGLAITLVYYNTEIFKKYNLTPPKTYSELIQIVKTLKSHGETPFALGAKDAWLPALTMEYLANRIGGSEPFEKAVANKKGWTDPSYIEAGKKLAELRDLGAFENGTLTNDYTASENLFMNGKAAMRVMINNEIGVFGSDQSSVKSKFGVFPFPAVEGGKGNVNSWLGMPDQNLAISSNTKNVKAAVAFVKLFTSPKYQKKNVELAQLLPTTKVQYDTTKVSAAHAQAAKYLSEAKEIFLFYDIKTGPVVGTAFNNAVQEIIAGENDIEKVLVKVNEAASK